MKPLNSEKVQNINKTHSHIIKVEKGKISIKRAILWVSGLEGGVS